MIFNKAIEALSVVISEQNTFETAPETLATLERVCIEIMLTLMTFFLLTISKFSLRSSPAVTDWTFMDLK